MLKKSEDISYRLRFYNHPNIAVFKYAPWSRSSVNHLCKNTFKLLDDIIGPDDFPKTKNATLTVMEHVESALSMS